MKIVERPVAPALFLAPMAGVTHSAFRRLVADFGGYGALFTEMLSGPAFLKEKLEESPYTRRRDCEGDVIYQFRLSGDEDIPAIFERVKSLDSIAIDINLGCPAPEIQQKASGAALWRDFPRLVQVMETIRSCYGGPLTIKCRLGDDPDDWRSGFIERLRLFESMGVAAITVHPRFSTEKLKRSARWSEFPWVASQTAIPIIGNGDITSVQEVETHPDYFAPLHGLMLGRIVAVKPWIFRDFAGLPPLEINHAEVWERFYRYTMEDFPPERAFGRLREFTAYFAQNFFWGHLLNKGIQKARTPESIWEAAMAFLDQEQPLSGMGKLR